MPDYRIIHYTITGRTLKEAANQFKFWEKAVQMASETRASYSNNYTTIRRGRNMIVSSCTINVDIEVEIPIWSNLSRSSVAAQREWNRFMKATMVHEMGHVNKYLSIKNASRLVIGMREDDANARISNLWNTIENAQDVYDTKTSHGATQHATLNESII